MSWLVSLLIAAIIFLCSILSRKYPAQLKWIRCSRKYPVKGMMFRDFNAGAVFDWHPAPQPQYIIYLEGEVEVQASDGEKKILKSGDILLAADTTGQGHITRTLTRGRSIIVITEE